MYKSFIPSKIEYGLFIYFPTQKSNALKLERIQYAAIRRALGLRNSTPNNILISYSLLAERARFLCNKFIVKSFSNEKTLTSQTLKRVYNKFNKKKRLKKKILLACLNNAMQQSSLIMQDEHFPLFTNEYETLIWLVSSKKMLIRAPHARP